MADCNSDVDFIITESTDSVKDKSIRGMPIPVVRTVDQVV